MAGSSSSKMGGGGGRKKKIGGGERPPLHVKMEGPQIHIKLLEAASCGDSSSLRTAMAAAAEDPSIDDLLGATPQGNTCLHVSSMRGHEGFCKDVLERAAGDRSLPLLLSAVNSDGETPLVAAVARGHASLASSLLRHYCCCCSRLEGGGGGGSSMESVILRQDRHGCNALHHAIRGGHRELALELIAAEPALSHHANKHGESPMYMAVMRNWEDVFDKLLEIPDSAHAGAAGFNALHAAVRNGNSAIAKKVMEKRPELSKQADRRGNTPSKLAVLWNKVGVLRVLLEHDYSLGYEVAGDGITLLQSAAFRGHVDIARELLKHCPDAPFHKVGGLRRTCLHQAARNGHTEFVQFVLETPQLQNLVNMRDSKGKTALHHAVHMCNPEIVAALLSHRYVDTTVINNKGSPAAWQLKQDISHAKTLNWNEVCMLMLKADPQNATSIYYLHKTAKERTTTASRKNAKSLTQTYTSNTSLVAILVATITFAAAFTLPGGYSSDAGSEGLPIMSSKFAFQAFLVFDTLAMCASFAVAFICIIARWEDYEFLLYYRSYTKKLMWFAYIATTLAFSTGLYTVLAPRLRWLAIGICSLVSLLPVLTKLLGEWPVLKLRLRLGKTYKPDLLDMV